MSGPRDLLRAISMTAFLLAISIASTTLGQGVEVGTSFESASVQALLGALNAFDESTRAQAVQELGNRGDPRAVPVLIRTLRDDPSVMGRGPARPCLEALHPDLRPHGGRSDCHA
jgi:hypothetical protein